MALTAFHKSLVLSAVEQRRTTETLNNALRLATDAVVGKVVPEDLASTKDAFLVMRAINQVEDLVVDSAFDADKNNTTLETQKKSKLVKSARALVVKSSIPADRLDSLFKKFDPASDIGKQRADRLIEIEKLRIEMLRVFSK